MCQVVNKPCVFCHLLDWQTAKTCAFALLFHWLLDVTIVFWLIKRFPGHILSAAKQKKKERQKQKSSFGTGLRFPRHISAAVKRMAKTKTFFWNPTKVYRSTVAIVSAGFADVLLVYSACGWLHWRPGGGGAVEQPDYGHSLYWLGNRTRNDVLFWMSDFTDQFRGSIVRSINFSPLLCCPGIKASHSWWSWGPAACTPIPHGVSHDWQYFYIPKSAARDVGVVTSVGSACFKL